MSLTRLHISHFRNLTDVECEPHPRVNLISGPNGSGKTSVLEAIYYLGFGRSFRSRSTRPVIQEGQDLFQIHGQVGDTPVGIERSHQGDARIRIAHQDVASAVELVKLLPLQLIDHSASMLIEGGPENRRRFLDWGVFHLGQEDFMGTWQTARKLLKLRNIALRTNSEETVPIDLWTREWIPLALHIDQWRQAYVDLWRPLWQALVSELLGDLDLSIDYSPGWDPSRSLEIALRDGIDEDRRKGFTRCGPQQADLRIRIRGIDAAAVLSRGQQKTLAWAMKLSQVTLLKQHGHPCLFLVDDLASELDQDAGKALYAVLERLDSQLFLTGTTRPPVGCFERQDPAVFHIRNGTLLKEGNK